MQRVIQTIAISLTLMGLSLGCLGDNDLADTLLFGTALGTGPQSPEATIGLQVTSVNGGYIIPEDKANGDLQLQMVLTRAPTADVVIPISLSLPGDSSANMSSVTFTPSNWDTPQILTITGVIESDTDGNKITDLVFGTATSDDPDYDGFTAPTVPGIIVVDDDSPSIVVSAPGKGLQTKEDGTTDKIAVALSTQPTANVTIPATIAITTAADEDSIDKTTLTFTTSNWNVPQIITVTGQDDNVIDGDIDFTVTFPNSSSADPDYNNKNYFSYHMTKNSSASQTNEIYGVNADDDIPGVTVSQTTRTFNEADPVGAANRFTVVLTKGPANDVDIPVSLTGDTGRATIDSALLTFTAGACPGVGNWCTPQTVTVSPVNNDVADGTGQLTAVLGVATNYGGTNPPDVSITVTDDDSAGVEVVQLNRNVVEATNQDAYFRLRLTSKPTANVTISFNENYDSGTPGLAVKPTTRMGGLDKSSVTFTPANWNVYQNVTYTPANDSIADGNIQFLVRLNECSSSDPKYSGLKPSPDITVNYQDNDVAGFTISANSSTTNTAQSAATISGFATDDQNNMGHGYASWQIKLRSQPLNTITVNLSVSASNSDGSIVAGQTLTFSPTCPGANCWSDYQTVQVEGGSDGTNEGNQTYSVNVSSVTGDLAYADGKTGYSDASVVARPSFSIYSCDNDAANFYIGCRKSGGFSTSEGGGTARLHVIGQSNPGTSCTIPVSSSDTSEGTVSPSSISVTTSNWAQLDNGSNSVVITGVDDGSFDGNASYTIQLGNPSCLPGFDVPDVSIRNTDNDQAFTIIGTANTSENGTSDTFQIKMQSAPASDVTFTIACAAGEKECASVSPSTVTIPASNTPQTITVTGKDDNRADGTQSGTVTFGPLSSSDLFYDGIQPPNASPQSNADNDKVIWITANPYNPNFNAGLGVADGYCGTDGNKPSWGSYKALLADSTTRVATTNGSTDLGQNAWVLQPNTDYYVKSGSAPYTTKAFTTNSYGLVTLPFNSGIGSGTYWTGLNSDWTTATNTCTNWTQNGTGGPPHETTYGNGGATNATALSAGTSDCNTTTTRYLICVQQ